MNLSRAVIDISKLGIDKEYFLLPIELRKQVCNNVITESFEKMSVKASQETRIITMHSVLQHSLEFYETQDEFEYCIIFRDLLEALKEKFG